MQREAALKKLERTRERAGRARIRALVLPIALFGAVWVAVFAQMATGNDPALSNNRMVATKGATSDGKGAAASTTGASAKPPRQRPATALAYDPVTGTIVRIPASSAQTAVSTPAPAQAPVITSQS